MNDDSIAKHMYCHVLSVLLTGKKKTKKKNKKKQWCYQLLVEKDKVALERLCYFIDKIAGQRWEVCVAECLCAAATWSVCVTEHVCVRVRFSEDSALVYSSNSYFLNVESALICVIKPNSNVNLIFKIY